MIRYFIIKWSNDGKPTIMETRINLVNMDISIKRIQLLKAIKKWEKIHIRTIIKDQKKIINL